MPRFLRTIRLDASDTHAFENAAEPGEWAVPGGFAFADLEPEEITGKRRQAFSNGFLSLESFGRSTFVTVSNIGDDQLAERVQALARHFVDAYGAPDLDAALPVARGEIDFAVELARGQPLNALLAVTRDFDDSGGIREEFRIVTPPGGTQHARVWDVEDDDA